MSVLIGHSSIDENGRAQGGKAGDQTGREVCTRSWYNKPWNVVIRPKSAAVAEKMAIACEQACSNSKIGYDQWERNSLYTQALKVGFNLSKITTPCECDCSSLMCICAIAAGAPAGAFYIGGNMRSTHTMRAAFKNTGMFDILTESKYLTSDKYLKRGDILLNEGSHTAMVLSNGINSNSSNSTTDNSGENKPNNSYVGKGIGTAIAQDNMNVRTGPTTNYIVIGSVPKGKAVEVLERTSGGWYKIVWPGAKEGYAYVSNSNNKYFTYEAKKPSNKFQPYVVSITASVLNVRSGPGTTYRVNTKVKRGEAYTIVEEKNGWGKLKSGAGWISLNYTRRVK